MRYLRLSIVLAQLGLTLIGCAPEPKPAPVPPATQRHVDVDVHDGAVKVDIEPKQEKK